MIGAVKKVQTRKLVMVRDAGFIKWGCGGVREDNSFKQ
jgi:hypothetical protein